jgi:hypothetical protein
MVLEGGLSDLVTTLLYIAKQVRGGSNAGIVCLQIHAQMLRNVLVKQAGPGEQLPALYLMPVGPLPPVRVPLVRPVPL